MRKIKGRKKNPIQIILIMRITNTFYEKSEKALKTKIKLVRLLRKI